MYVFAGDGCDQAKLLINQSVSHNQDSPTLSACFPVHDAGSVLLDVVGNCQVTLRSGGDCKGESWAYNNGQCANQLFAGVFIACN